MIRYPLPLFLCLLLAGCADPAREVTAPPRATPSLKATFADDFRIGAALGKRQIRGGDSLALALVAREYNTITPENDLKWENLHPAPDSFTWAAADAYVAFGEAHGMFVIGHALVWHSQLADYVREISTPAELRRALADHIGAVAGRYRGRIDGWDVVNEALNQDGTYRESVFYRVLGEDYLPLAFRLAAEAAPEAELYYNDYDLWLPAKREGAIRMIGAIRAAGGRVDAIGMQAHYGLEKPPLAAVESSIEAFHAAGLRVMITELDVGVLPNPWDLEGAEVDQDYANDPAMNPYAGGLPDSVQTRLATRYADLFSLFRRHADKIDRVTFWGVHDGQSWLNGWPIKGRTNHPLLFDRNYRKKPAYAAITSPGDAVPAE